MDYNSPPISLPHLQRTKRQNGDETEYHLQFSGQIEYFNATMISRHYVAEYQKNLDKFVFSPTYAYNVQIHQTTKLPPFSLATNGILPEPTAMVRPTPPDVSDIDSPLAYSTRLIRRATLL